MRTIHTARPDLGPWDDDRPAPEFDTVEKITAKRPATEKGITASEFRPDLPCVGTGLIKSRMGETPNSVHTVPRHHHATKFPHKKIGLPFGDLVPAIDARPASEIHAGKNYDETLYNGKTA